MNRFKRMMSLLLTLAMLLTAFPMSAWAEDDVENSWQEEAVGDDEVDLFAALGLSGEEADPPTDGDLPADGEDGETPIDDEDGDQPIDENGDQPIDENGDQPIDEDGDLPIDEDGDLPADGEDGTQPEISPAQALADELGLTLEELALQTGISEEDLVLLSQDEVDQLRD